MALWISPDAATVVRHSRLMAWQDIARAQHGAITRQQLLSAGLTDHQVQTLLIRGRLLRHSKQGVYCAAAVAPTEMTRAWLAVLATGAAVSHLSAARLWGVEVPHDGRLHVTRPARRATRMPSGVRVHRVLLPEGAVVLRNGLPMVERSRTVLDCLGLVTLPQARRLFDRALQQKWITIDGVRRRLDNEPGRRGNVALRRLLDESTEGDAVSERIMMGLLRSAAITGWRPNVRIDVGWTTFTVDLAFERERVVIEVDGWAHHVNVDRFRADRVRDNALRLAGWTVYRFTWDQLVERPWSVIATVRAALAQAA